MSEWPVSPEANEIIDAFEQSECAVLLGMRVTGVWDTGISVAMDTAGKNGPGGVAHGGAVFTLADQAFGIAANMDGIKQVALSANIQYISPATGLLEAVAERLTGNDMCTVYRVSVSSAGKLVAVFEGVGIHV
ncbi:MAG TPA: PaaI family thioesterase [Methanoregulaceae archaeon]|nr:PaaI family thioesterase [Methanoregulaceae archaeon]